MDCNFYWEKGKLNKEKGVVKTKNILMAGS